MSSSPDTAVAARDSHDGSGFAGTSTNDISIAGEATTRAEFDTFAAAEYEQDLPQQAPDLNDELELSTEESVPPTDCKILPLLELYPNMEQDHICKPSVERAIRCIAPRWAKYCGTINQQEPWVRNHGLQLYSKREDIQNHQQYDRERTDGFFRFLSADLHVGKSVLIKAKTFVNTHLKCEHYSRQKEVNQYAELVQIKVGESLSIQKSVSTVTSRAAAQSLDACEDIQAGLQQLLTPEQTREMALSVFRAKSNGAVAKLHPFYRLQFASQYWSMSATTRRGEEFRDQRLIQRNHTTLDEIGFRGMRACQIVTNKAKHNKDGRLEYTYIIPNMDSLKDAGAWSGALFLWRLKVDNEVFPDFTGEDYKAIFGVWTYPCLDDRLKHIESAQFTTNFDSFYFDNGITCEKVTHQPRFQAIQEMDRLGLSLPVQHRMCGHKGKEQTVHTRCYANNPPTKGVVQRAGGNYKQPKTFDPTQFMLSTEECRWCDDILKDLVPDLVAQEQTIRAEFNATKSYKARTDRRLHTKLGLVSCTLWDIRQFIIMAASPELDPRTFMLGNDTRSIRQRFLNDDLAALFHLPSFSKEPFGLLEQSILGRLRAKQSTAQLFTSETESNVERLLKQHIAGPIAQIYQLNQSTLADMRQMITRCCPDTFSSTISAVTPSPVARREEPNNDFPSEPSLTLADGRTPRKRRPKVHQQQAISQEYRRRAHESSDGNSRVDPVLLSDKGCKTFADYWKVWVDKWQQLETETEGAWRSDLNGSGGRRQWWSHRSPMFRLMQHLMTEKDMSEEQAVEEGTTIYNSISRKKGRDKPNIKDVGKRFKEELVKHGINLRGRPKGKRKESSNDSRPAKRKKNNNPTNDGASEPLSVDTQRRRDNGNSNSTYGGRVSRTTTTENEFEAVFGPLIDNNPRLRDIFDCVMDESLQQQQQYAEQRELERNQQQQRNAELRWEYANQNRAVGVPLPPMPPGYGTTHAPPFRPVPGQPVIELPPNHHYADVEATH